LAFAGGITFTTGFGVATAAIVLIAPVVSVEVSATPHASVKLKKITKRNREK
jgi:hypothetical protein